MDKAMLKTWVEKSIFILVERMAINRNQWRDFVKILKDYLIELNLV